MAGVQNRVAAAAGAGGLSDVIERTPKPSSASQLKVLLHKQIRVDAKRPLNFLLRTLLGPILLFAYGIGNLAQYGNFEPTTIDALVTTYESSPFPTIPGVMLLDGKDDVSALAEVLRSGFATGADGGVNETDFTNVSTIFVIEPLLGNEPEFKAMCANMTASKEVTSCVYVDAGSPDWSVRVYVQGDSIPSHKSVIDDFPGQNFGRYLGSGLSTAQRTIGRAILRVEAAENNIDIDGVSWDAANPTYMQALPKLNKKEGTSSTPWWYLLLPALYVGFASIFRIGFQLSPLIADARKGIVRAFGLAGVSAFTYWMHWVVVFSLDGIVYSALVVLAIILTKFVTLSSPFLFFVNILIATTQSNLMIVLLPRVVTKEEQASLVPFLLMLMSIGVYAAVLSLDAPIAVRAILTIINPLWSYFHAVTTYVATDWFGPQTGISGENYWSSDLGPVTLAQLSGVVFYSLVVWYVYSPKKHTMSQTDLTHVTEAFAKEQRKNEKERRVEPLAEGANVTVSLMDLRKTFKTTSGEKAMALDGLGMQVCRDEIFGFLGHNGAGKTTALSVLSGEVQHDGGLAEYHFTDGTSVRVGDGNDNLVRSRIGVCPQHDILIEELTCREILRLFGRLKGEIPVTEAGQSVDDAIEAEVQRRIEDIALPDAQTADLPIKTYSGGMKRKVSIAVAMLGDPQVLFLDEPTSGVDPVGRRDIWQLIERAKAGRSIVLTTHFMDEADLLSDRIGIINKGQLVACGSPLFLKNRFGAGYKLEYTSMNTDTAKNVSSAILRLAPDAIQDVSGTESEDDVYKWALLQGAEPQFAQLLRMLEDNKCKDVSLELTTMEQVFLRIGSEGVKLPEIGVGEGGICSSGDDLSKSLDTNGNRVMAMTVDSISGDAMDNAVRDIWKDARTGEGMKTKKKKKSAAHEDQVEHHYHRPSFFAQVWAVTIAAAKNGKRGPTAIFFGIALPAVYMVTGIVLSKVFSGGESEGDIVSPDSFHISPALLLTGNSDGSAVDTVARVFGMAGPSLDGQPIDMDGVSVLFNTSAPSTPEDFFDTSSTDSILIGGLLSNLTLMYNQSLSHAFPVLQAMLLNDTLSTQLSDAVSVNTLVEPLPYAKEAGFNINSLVVPVCLNLGFFPLAFIVIDLVLFREYKLFESLQVMGVARFTTYVGVFVTSVVTSFALFATLAFVLCLAVGSPAAGNGGRWLALLAVMLSYAFAAPGFAMLFAPLFKTLKAAKDGMPPIWILFSMAPFLVLQSLTSTFSDPATPILIADIVSVFPPYAFQRALSSYLDLSDVFDDPDLTWAQVWAWENKVGYSILLLLLTGSASWALVWWQTRPIPVSQNREIKAVKEPDHYNDPDVAEERARSAVEGNTGIKARCVAKCFKVAPDSLAYRIRYVDIFGYWMPRILFRIDRFAKQFTEKQAVSNVSFGVQPNELYVLLGPNGAGKTSTIDMLVRNTLPDAGSVILCGCDDRTAKSLFKPFKDGDVSYCPQFDALFPEMTVKEHFELVVRLRGLDPKAGTTLTHVAAIRELFDLDQHARKYSSSLSGGYKRKLSLALSMVGFPQILILDEASTGVDPAARAHINSIFTSGRRLATHEGFDLPATLLSTHVMEEAQALATRVGIMVAGELVTTGTIPRLQAKHCEFNYVEVTFKTGSALGASEELIRYLTDAGLVPTVMDTQVRGVKLQLPIDHSVPNTLNLANVFELIEQVKERIGVQYYSVSPMGLEQIFMLMTKATETHEEDRNTEEQ